MSEHRVEVVWRRETEGFGYDEYTRGHEWRFGGARTVPASAAPAFRGDPGRVDPEAAFAASLSSCHMLTFLALAARKRLFVDSYEDSASAYLEKGENGRLQVTRVVLRPRIVFGGNLCPSPEEIERMHHRSHEECFIANSVTTEVVVEAPEVG